MVSIKLVFEGIDGCGKDTQIALLKDKIDFTHFKYPTPEFPSIREYLEKKRSIEPKSLFLLFLSDIANEQEKLADTLETCIIDRYVFSTIAYDKYFPYGQAKDLVSDIDFVRPDTVLPMMYMPDSIQATLDLMDADGASLVHCAEYNLAAMSFSAAELAAEIRKQIPEFVVSYDPDPVRQAIADSWPKTIDDSAARREWGWRPRYDLARMTADMLEKLGERYRAGQL